MNIAKNINNILSSIPSNVKLVAVSKTMKVEQLKEAYNCGQKIFGENYVQELLSKQYLMPEDTIWHFIGHLQSNKVKFIVPFVSCIQSVDSEKILKVIDKEAKKSNRVIDVLLQFSIANDYSKFGFDINDPMFFLWSDKYKLYNNIRFCGVMGMGSFTEDIKIIIAEYKSLKLIFDRLKQTIFNKESSFSEISMGMSHDYDTAIKEGSTMIRVGSSIFGNRVYT